MDGPEALAQMSSRFALGIGMVFVWIGGLVFLVPLFLPLYTNTLRYEEDHPGMLKFRRWSMLLAWALWCGIWLIVLAKLGVHNEAVIGPTYE